MYTTAMLLPLALFFATLIKADDATIAAGYHETLAQYEHKHHIVIAHGVILGFAFAIMYPLGAIFIKALSFKGLLWFHAGWQVIAYVFSLVGLGLGLYLVTAGGLQLKSSTGHPIIGIIVIGLIALLPPLGWIHHKVFVSTRARSIWTYLHRWLGRFVLVLGGINGGLGIWMAHRGPTWAVITYTACAATFYTLWLATVTIFRKRTPQAAANQQKLLDKDEPRESDVTLRFPASEAVHTKELA